MRQLEHRNLLCRLDPRNIWKLPISAVRCSFVCSSNRTEISDNVVGLRSVSDFLFRIFRLQYNWYHKLSTYFYRVWIVLCECLTFFSSSSLAAAVAICSSVFFLHSALAFSKFGLSCLCVYNLYEFQRRASRISSNDIIFGSHILNACECHKN